MSEWVLFNSMPYGSKADGMHPATDEIGRVLHSTGQPLIEGFAFSAFSMIRIGKSKKKYVEQSIDMHGQVSLYSDCVLVHCEKVSKGGGWMSASLADIIILNLVSLLRARSRNKGRSAAGRIDLVWLSDIGITLEKGREHLYLFLKERRNDHVGIVMFDFTLGLGLAAGAVRFSEALVKQVVSDRLSTKSISESETQDLLNSTTFRPLRPGEVRDIHLPQSILHP
jgi:hypothetical protein